MKRIKSFEIDHTCLTPGLYLSRKDGDVTTYDLRFVRPNTPPFLKNGVMHTIEHLVCHLCPQQPPSGTCGLFRSYGLPYRFLFSHRWAYP